MPRDRFKRSSVRDVIREQERDQRITDAYTREKHLATIRYSTDPAKPRPQRAEIPNEIRVKKLPPGRARHATLDYRSSNPIQTKKVEERARVRPVQPNFILRKRRTGAQDPDS